MSIEDTQKIAIAPFRVYEFPQMPFGLRNSTEFKGFALFFVHIEDVQYLGKMKKTTYNNKVLLSNVPGVLAR